MYDKILVPLDGSIHAEAVLPHVEQLGRSFGATLVFVRVVAPPALTKVQETQYQTLRRQELDRRNKEAELYLKGVQGEFRTKGISTKTRVVTGSPVSAVLNAARQEDVDLVAIANHPASRLPRPFGGSLAARLLQRANCPVLVVRPQRQA